MAITAPQPPADSQADTSHPSPALSYEDIPGSTWPSPLQSLLAPLTVLRTIPFLENTRSTYGHADLVRSLFPGFPSLVMLNSARAMEAVFSAPGYSFDTASSNAMLQPLLGGESLLQIDGMKHQQRRKLLMPPFHGSSIQAYGQIVVDITQQVMAQWQPQQVFPIHLAMQDITLRVILRAVFGLQGGDRAEQLRLKLSELLNAFNSPLLSTCLFFKPLQLDWGPWSPWGQFLRRKRAIDQLLLAEIADRRQQPPQDDVLSLLLAARDETGQALTDSELRDELMTLLFAGHETTASALAWAIYWIHHEAGVRDRLLAELAELGPNPDPMAVAKLPYLSAVCNETLRIYPVALFTFGRVLKQPFTLLGYDLKPGTLLSPCIYLVHRDPAVYTEPDQFKPERFLDRQFSPYEFIPFGGSNRRCVGYAFALFEMKVVLAEMLRTQEFSLVSQRPAVPERRGVAFAPSEGIRVTVKSFTT